MVYLAELTVCAICIYVYVLCLYLFLVCIFTVVGADCIIAKCYCVFLLVHKNN